MARSIALLVLAIVFLWLIAWAFQRRLIYFPSAGVPPSSDMGLRGAEAVAFDTDDHLALNGWFVPAAAPSGITVVVFNGNAGNRAHRAPLARELADRGISTLLFDYRGYGENRGSPSEAGLTNDARAARRYLASRVDIDQARIAYFGESLGAAVAVSLAIESPPLALVLRSPFTSLADVASHHYPFLPVRWLLRDRFPSADRIAHVHCPVLVITAEHDSIVPSEESVRMYETAHAPKRLLVLPNTDHNDGELLSGTRLVDAVLEFLTVR